MTTPTITSGTGPMTDRNESLIALAERCEKATGPDRELDAEVAVAAFPDKYLPCPPDRQVKVGCVYVNHDKTPYHGGDIGPISQCDAPKFTASLDAAMTLVPEGWDWSAGIETVEGFPPAMAEVSPQAQPFPVELDITVEVVTPALALTAAALRARAAQ